MQIIHLILLFIHSNRQLSKLILGLDVFVFLSLALFKPNNESFELFKIVSPYVHLNQITTRIELICCDFLKFFHHFFQILIHFDWELDGIKKLNEPIFSLLKGFNTLELAHTFEGGLYHRRIALCDVVCVVNEILATQLFF